MSGVRRERLDQLDGASQVRARLLERTAPPGLFRAVPVRVGRLLVALGAVEVRRDHQPVAGLGPRQGVAETAVDAAAPGGRLNLVCDLSKELVPELVAPRAIGDWFEDLCVHQALQRRIELPGGKGDRRVEQRTVDLSARGGSGGGNRERRRRRVQPRDEWLIQSRRDRARDRNLIFRYGTVIGSGADELLQIKRDAAAATGQLEAVLLGEPVPEGVDQFEAARLRERLELDPLPRAVLASTRGPDHEHAGRRVLRERRQQSAGRVIEPVKVLGHDDRGAAGGAGVDVSTRGLADLFLQPLTFDGDRLIAGGGRDPHQRRQQRQGVGGAQPDARDLSREVLQARDGVVLVGDPAAILDQGPHGVEPHVGVKRRAVQLEDRCAAEQRLIDECRQQARLADTRLPADQYAPGALGLAGRSASPGLPEALELGFALDQWRRPTTQYRDATLTDHPKRLQRVLDAFDDLGIAGLDLEPIFDEHRGPRPTARRSRARRSPAGALRRSRPARRPRPRRSRRTAGRGGRRRGSRGTRRHPRRAAGSR